MQSPFLGDRYRRSLIPVGCVAAFLYANFLLDWVLRGFEGMDVVVSQLAAPGQPYAPLLRVTDVITAVLVVFLLPGVRRAMPAGGWREVTTWAMVVFALGAVVAAVVASPCGPGQVCAGRQLQATVHDGSSVVSDTALFVAVAAAWFATRRAGPVWFRRSAVWIFWLGGVASSAAFEFFNVVQRPLWAVGATQRIHILWMSAWIVCLAIYAKGSGDEG